MRMMVGLLVVAALCYQLFFRYDTWPSREQEGVLFERDNLTGEVRKVEPGEKRDIIARLVGGVSFFGKRDDHTLLEPVNLSGESKDTGESSDQSDEAMLMNMIEHARPLPVPKEVIIAKEAPPVPLHPAVSEDASHPFAVRQIDLNSDGSFEEIIQAVSEHDGLLDISVVKNGQEILFHRGRDLTILPSKNMGWADLSTTNGKTRTIFRYSPNRGVYEPMEVPQAVARKS